MMVCGCSTLSECMLTIKLMLTHLRNTDRLLLHDFMDCSPIGFLHFVKFINATYSMIGKHECTTFEYLSLIHI